ncbi:MAG: two-component regulator propeller domain-containing protein, partial [Anaerolineae bacterium]
MRLARAGGALAAISWAVVAVAAMAAPGAESTLAPADLPPADLPGRWQTFANADDVTALAATGGVVWAGSRAGGLVRWPADGGDPVQYLAPQDPLGGNTIHDLAVDGQGRLWIATSGGLSVLEDGATADRDDDTWRTYTVASTFGGLPSDDVRAVAVDGDTIWVGAAQEWDPSAGWVGGGLGHLDTRGTPGTEDDIWAPVATFEGTGQSAPNGSVALGLVSDNISAIAVAPGGGVWIATGPHWRLEQPANPEKAAEWHPVHGGLSHLDPAGTFDTADDAWRPYSCEDPIQDSAGRPLIACHMADLAMDPQGRMWSAAGGLGVVAFPGDRGQLTPGVVYRFQGGGGLDAGFVAAVAAPRDGNAMWLATRSDGVLAVDPGPSLGDDRDDVWRGFGPDQGLAGVRAQALTVGEGVVWVGLGPEKGTGQGLARIDLGAGRVTGHLVTAGHGAPPSNFVTALAFGAPGTRWAGHVFVGTGSRAQRTFGAGLADLDTAATPRRGDDVWTNY